MPLIDLYGSSGGFIRNAEIGIDYSVMAAEITEYSEAVGDCSNSESA